MKPERIDIYRLAWQWDEAVEREEDKDGAAHFRFRVFLDGVEVETATQVSVIDSGLGFERVVLEIGGGNVVMHSLTNDEWKGLDKTLGLIEQ